MLLVAGPGRGLRVQHTGLPEPRPADYANLKLDRRDQVRRETPDDSFGGEPEEHSSHSAERGQTVNLELNAASLREPKG